MRQLLVLLSLVLATGCSLTPTQKKVAGFVAGALVVGAIAAHDSSDNNDAGVASPTMGAASMPCRPQPDGSCR
jgi:hypothetical protein